MSMSKSFRSSCAIAALLILSTVPATRAQPQPKVVAQPQSSALVSRLATDLSTQPKLSDADTLALLQRDVKYVFVLFQENRSFDLHFGTFPGAHGLFTRPAAKTSGFAQQIVNTDGTAAPSRRS